MFDKQMEHISTLHDSIDINEVYSVHDWLPEEFFSNELLWFNLECFQFYQLAGVILLISGDFMRELISAILMHRGMNG